jgi:predicted AAA+ superfamily ATPase
LGLDLTHLFLNDDLNFINKGTIAELFVGLELLKNNPDPLAGLYYWHREAKNSQAEVDYVIQQNQDIIPIEVKAGTKGAMQSMYLFMEEKNTPFGIRTSLENFGEIEKIKIIPIYAIGIAIQKKSKT